MQWNEFWVVMVSVGGFVMMAMNIPISEQQQQMFQMQTCSE
jgi:hypothetical protein